MSEIENAEIVTTVESVLEAVLPELPDQDYTPYQIATVLNLILANLRENGLYDGAEIKPQMIYNYSTNGRIVRGSKKHNLHRYNVSEVREFVERFINRTTDDKVGTTSDLKSAILRSLQK